MSQKNPALNDETEVPNKNKTLPKFDKIASVKFYAANAVAISQSPFTFKSSTHFYGGQQWAVDVTYPPLERSEAEEIIAFLLDLRGSVGTFRMGDPNAVKTRGDATGGFTLSNATNINDEKITVSQLGTNNKFAVGDYLELNGQLLKILRQNPVSGDIHVWPRIRKVSKQGDSVYYEKPRGLFRLKSASSDFSINNASQYGISFSAVEVV